MQKEQSCERPFDFKECNSCMAVFCEGTRQDWLKCDYGKNKKRRFSLPKNFKPKPATAEGVCCLCQRKVRAGEGKEFTYSPSKDLEFLFECMGISKYRVWLVSVDNKWMLYFCDRCYSTTIDRLGDLLSADYKVSFTSGGLPSLGKRR